MPSKLKQKIIQSHLTVPVILLILCVLAYGLLIPTLGFYWDDWPYAWINHMFGPGGYPDYVALDRPHSAWIFMGLAALLGEQPIGYHLSALMIFWLCGVLFWYLLRSLWPGHKKEALWASLLFVVYPGFLGHPQAIIYNHHFIAMALYLFSLIGMMRAIKAPVKGRLPWRVMAWHLPSLGALILSQFSIEYFLGWEAIRPIVVWIAINQRDLDLERRVGWGLLHTIPYWLASLGFLLWRVFIFQFPTYQPLGGGETAFVFHEWVRDILTQVVETVFYAWVRAFPHLSPGEFSRPFWLAYLVMIGLTTVFVFLALLFYRHEKTGDKSRKTSRGSSFGRTALFMAIIGVAFSGWPFWLTDLDVDIYSTFYSRLTIPFIPWIGLLFAAVLHFFYRARWLRVPTIVLITFLVGGSTGYHLWNANFYRNEWQVLQRYFQQMTQRIPDLTLGTSLVINDLRALSLYQDDSLTAIMNWTYAPENTSKEIDYMVQYLSVRLGDEIPALEPGLPIEHPLRSLHFSGTTDQILVVYYEPPGCLRVLDNQHPERIPEDFTDFMRSSLSLSDLSLIQTSPDQPATPPVNLFDQEPGETWCLYFTQAELAAQRMDWAEVAELGDQAFSIQDQSNEVTELFVFIEGYLRVGRFDSALFVSEYLRERSSGTYDQAVCELWREVERDSPNGFDGDFDTNAVYGSFCNSE